MAIRIPWDIHEAALLLEAFLAIQDGADRTSTLQKLSGVLRTKAKNAKVEIDDVYRNRNGMSMQYTGISYAWQDSSPETKCKTKVFCHIVDLYRRNPEAYASLLKEAKELAAPKETVESAFFAYAKDHSRADQAVLKQHLEDAGRYCKLNRSILGMDDIKAVRDVLQTVTEGKTLRLKYGKNADRIRDAVSVYYAFIKTWRKPKLDRGNADKQEDVDTRLLRYGSWLKEKKQLSDKTASIYRQALRSFVLAANGNNLSFALLYSDGDELSSALNSYLEQSQLGRGRSSQYRCAVSAYIEFIGEKYTSFPAAKLEPKGTPKPMEVKPLVSPELAEKLTSVISTSFANGIRPASIIDRNKLERLYKIKYGEAIPEDIDLPVVLPSLGILIEDTVRVISNEQKQSIISCVKDIFDQGYGVICYNELIEIEAELFTEARLNDPILLRNVLKKLMPECYCKEKYIQKSGSSLEDEILRAFGNDRVLQDKQLKERLPFIDLQTIKWTLSGSDAFVWTSLGTFARTDSITIAEKDIAYVYDSVLPKMHETGFISLNHLQLLASCDLNPDVSFFAVRDVIFLRLLSKEAVREGVIATPKDNPASSYDIIKAFCLSQKETTLADLNSYEEEVAGSVHGMASKCAAWHMVRVEAEKYVADSEISFDVDAVDNAIALFVQNRMISIKSVSSFTSFPWVEGYSWNLYLVESFVRRFSKRFRIDGGPAATSYVGCISLKQAEYPSYEDRLAAIVLQDRVTLEEKAIGDYLTSNKFILRRTGVVSTILGKALKLREQRSADSV